MKNISAGRHFFTQSAGKSVNNRVDETVFAHTGMQTEIKNTINDHDYSENG